MTTTLDIGATAHAIMWPFVTLILLAIYHKKIPGFVKALLERLDGLVKALSGRIKSIQWGGVNIDLADAKLFSPPEIDTIENHILTSDMATSLTLPLLQLLADPKVSDYIILDLKEGKGWLSSRLFISSILFDNIKGIKAFVFVSSKKDSPQKYIGWAEPKKVRSALAIFFTKLEACYGAASKKVFEDFYEAGSHFSQNYKSVEDGQMLSALGNNLLVEFLRNVQADAPDSNKKYDWFELKGNPPKFEYATLLDENLLGGLPGIDLNTHSVQFATTDGTATSDKMKILLDKEQKFVAVTGKDHQFEKLIDRYELLEKVSETFVNQSASENRQEH